MEPNDARGGVDYLVLFREATRCGEESRGESHPHATCGGRAILLRETGRVLLKEEKVDEFTFLHARQAKVIKTK